MVAQHPDQDGSSGLAVIRPGTVAIPADEWNERRIAFIRQNYCGNAPDPEASAFIDVCKRRGLAPEEKQIYLIPRKGKWVPQTSIDGYRLIAERSGVYAGSDDAIFEESGGKLPNGRRYPDKATVTVWKIVAGIRCPYTSSAYWDEFNGGENLWLTLPHVMLAKCAESQALRKAFPADLSGIYTIEEMDQADAGPSNRSQSNQSASAAGAITTWNEFWPAAKAKGIKDPAAFKQLTGKMAPEFGSPAAAWKALLAALPEEEPGAMTPPADDIIEATARTIDRDSGEIIDAPFDPEAAAWRDRVEAAHTDTDLGRALVDLSNLMAEAGSDPAKWDALIALSPTENRLKQIRMEHLKSGAKTDAGNVATYNRRAAELKAKATAGK